MIPIVKMLGIMITSKVDEWWTHSTQYKHTHVCI